MKCFFGIYVVKGCVSDGPRTLREPRILPEKYFVYIEFEFVCTRQKVVLTLLLPVIRWFSRTFPGLPPVFGVPNTMPARKKKKKAPDKPIQSEISEEEWLKKGKNFGLF